MNKLIAALASYVILSFAASAQAGVYKLDFTASNFGPGIFSRTAAPQSPITGSITFTTSVLGAPVTSIDAINLIIAGHTYTASEIGSGSFGDRYFFGATAGNSAGVTQSGTDDFSIIVSSNTKSFTYARTGVFDSWNTASVVGTYTLQAAAVPVPEPGSLALLGAGFAGLGVLRRRRPSNRAA